MHVKFITMATIAMFAGTAAMADLPSLPNPNWEYGDPETSTDTTVTVEERDFNRASESSDDRASDRNRSDFRETTTTTTVTTTTTTPAINPGGQTVDEKSVTEESEETTTETTIEKILPN